VKNADLLTDLCINAQTQTHRDHRAIVIKMENSTWTFIIRLGLKMK